MVFIAPADQTNEDAIYSSQLCSYDRSIEHVHDDNYDDYHHHNHLF